LIETGEQNSRKLTGSQFLMVLLFFASLLLAAYYFDLGRDHDDSEELVTLAVIASDTPEHIPYSKHNKRRYSLKAQEFNCYFRIIDGAYDLIRSDDKLRERLETI
jgi:hypothetical protein